MTIRFIENSNEPPIPQSVRDEADAEHRRQLEERLRVEREGAQREREQQELDHLRRGGDTSRMAQARQYAAYLHLLGAGRWTPVADEAASRGTMFDNGTALRKVNEAARKAVAETVAPMFEAARAEIEAATRERDEIVAKANVTPAWWQRKR